MFILTQLIGFASLLAASVAQGNPQCPNTRAFDNPLLRTTCYKGTWFIVPVPKATVESLVPFPLITPNYDDATLFPQGFPAGSHPVVYNTGYQNDIRMISLRIDSLMRAAITVPYTDRTRDGQTPFNYPIRNYIGGTNGQDLMSVVPSAVGSVEGTIIFPGSFEPDNDAFAPSSAKSGALTARVQQIILPNPISGPAVEPTVFDLNFEDADAPIYNERTFKALINQPLILNNGLCQRNPYYFNETFAGTKLREGNVTVVGPLAGAAPRALAGSFFNEGGFSGNGEMIGYNPERCFVAAARADPAAFGL